MRLIQRSASEPAHACTRGFTLVEMMIVIGIVVLLISILMPALSKVRDLAQTTACMSNLRQLGQAMAMYASENYGYIVPAGYRDASKNTTDGWCTILVAKGYLSSQRVNSAFAPPSSDSSVFRCPAGVDLFMPAPISQIDLGGAQPYRFPQSGTTSAFDPKLIMDVWYGINGEGSTSGSGFVGGFDPAGPHTYTGAPCRRLPQDQDVTMTENTLIKLTRLGSPTDLVFLFDGYFMNIWGRCSRINARHGRGTTTNILLFDGHVETVKTSTLPQHGPSDPVTGHDIDNLATLNANFPYPKWRLEQN